MDDVPIEDIPEGIPIEPILDDENQPFERAPVRLYVGAAMLITFMVLSSLIAWFSFFQANNLEQPLAILACTPQSFELGETDQSECELPYQARNDVWYSDDTTPIAGTVCNNSDEPVAYRIEVALEPIQTDDVTRVRILLIDLRTTYPPGCTPEGYNFPYEIPPLLFEGVPDGTDLGLWKLTGIAVPVNRAEYLTYQWNVTNTFNLVTGPRPDGE